ncbi:MAG: VWA domain-containing protein [Bacteroidota bacterium]
MKTKVKIHPVHFKVLIFVWLVFVMSLRGFTAPQDIDFNNSLGTYTFNFSSTPVSESIGLLSPTVGANAYWEFSSIPFGAVLTDVSGFTTAFEVNGISVQLPPGVSASTPVPQTDVVSITDTGPLVPGSFSFTIVVTSEDGLNTQTRTYEIIIAQAMDLILVFDRSGSMGTTTSASVTRWDALKEAATNFANLYQTLERTEDRLSITYFETDLVPASACCNAFINYSNTIGTTINTDLNANSPGGMTAMGAGLKNAQSKLTDPSKTKSILLFTDGRQNQIPMVNLDGQGYSDSSSIPTGVKIFTLGIDNPNGTYHTTLWNLALNNGGSYNTTDDGSAFTFEVSAGADVRGDLSGGFTDQFVAMLAESSPQLIDRSSTSFSSGSPPFTLQTFQLNKKVDKLLLEFVFNRKFEIPELAQVMTRIQVTKDGNPVIQYAKPSWVGNYTNTLLLAFSFDEATDSPLPPLSSEGSWAVQMSDVSSFRLTNCNLTSLADDHRLHIKKSYINLDPKVNESFPISLTLDWLSHPITDASVEVIVLRPGEDLNDLLARDSLVVDVSSAQDAGTPGRQKYEELMASDPSFKEKLKRSENLVTLSHTSDGNYSGTFNGMSVSGVYRILFRINGTHPEAGQYQRILSESIYVSFSSVDMDASGVTSKKLKGKLEVKMRPKTSYNRLVGPAMGDGFSVDNPGINIDEVIDHQDGSYTLVFSGNINEDTKFQLLGQELYAGPLVKIAKSDSFIGKIVDFLKSLGLPMWLIWLIIILIIAFLVWRIIKKKP